ncbi:TOMM precursor leader peptide-binding protein [Streptomyces bohaiensis]|uniref:TOMM leader peptide-binding protein n=1 Tax=Streptomyces bohaiensis TaxID=1431344 RepID=A0ABX1C703_9ACTN|nr:TOMM precursor leader peptide-binding protein [Streptomyces bohaiensis]NJQ14954.1 TOMM precursor leader peptide-binding protein [Streptomyces bohaiensis]
MTGGTRPAQAPSDAAPAPAAAPAPTASLALTCRRLAALLRRALASLGYEQTAVSVRELGVRDAFAPGAQRWGGYGGEPGDGCDGADAGVPVALYGRHAVVGPLPGSRACPHCLARRWQGARSPLLREALERGFGTRAVGASPYVTPFAADALAALIVGALTTTDAAGDARPAAAATGSHDDVWLLDLATLSVRRHRLVADPECPRCGEPEAGADEYAGPEPRPAPVDRPGGSPARRPDPVDPPRGRAARSVPRRPGDPVDPSPLAARGSAGARPRAADSRGRRR